MSAQKGKDLLLKVDSDGAGTFATVAGLRSRSIAFNTETVDITHAESAGQWRELLAGAGAKHAKVHGRRHLQGRRLRRADPRLRVRRHHPRLAGRSSPTSAPSRAPSRSPPSSSPAATTARSPSSSPSTPPASSPSPRRSPPLPMHGERAGVRGGPKLAAAPRAPSSLTSVPAAALDAMAGSRQVLAAATLLFGKQRWPRTAAPDPPRTPRRSPVATKPGPSAPRTAHQRR